MAECDGDGVRRVVRPRDLFHLQNAARHFHDLMLVRAAVADDGLLDLHGLVFKNRQPRLTDGEKNDPPALGDVDARGDVLTEEQEAERRSNENKVRSQRFMEALDVDEMIAHLLIAEGFSTVDEVALVPLHELAEIEGFDEDIATELQDRAKEFVAKRDAEFAEKSKTLGIDDTLKTVTGLDQEMILTLAEKGVKTLDDLADLAADELIEMLGENTLSQTEANKVIMAAREHWFENEGQEGGDERK